jgi:hypothetical protein
MGTVAVSWKELLECWLLILHRPLVSYRCAPTMTCNFLCNSHKKLLDLIKVGVKTVIILLLLLPLMGLLVVTLPWSLTTSIGQHEWLQWPTKSVQVLQVWGVWSYSCGHDPEWSMCFTVLQEI